MYFSNNPEQQPLEHPILQEGVPSEEDKNSQQLSPLSNYDTYRSRGLYWMSRHPWKAGLIPLGIVALMVLIIWGFPAIATLSASLSFLAATDVILQTLGSLGAVTLVLTVGILAWVATGLIGGKLMSQRSLPHTASEQPSLAPASSRSTATPRMPFSRSSTQRQEAALSACAFKKPPDKFTLPPAESSSTAQKERTASITMRAALTPHILSHAPIPTDKPSAPRADRYQKDDKFAEPIHKALAPSQ